MPTKEPVAPNPLFEGIEAKIDALESDYLDWWTTAMPDSALVPITVLKDAQAFAERQFEGMSLGELDAYAGQVDSWLPVVNKLIPPLERYYNQMKALVGLIYVKAGFRGDPYKDQVEGDSRVAAHLEKLRLVEKLCSSISKQLSSIDSRNFRIGQEIKAGIWAGNLRNLEGGSVPQKPQSFRQS